MFIGPLSAAHKSNGAMALCNIQLNKNTMQRLDFGKLANMAQIYPVIVMRL